jgi:predicted pyridoxine 5'-phosphate oxidase superfamily flavin-nucleotide-binding protein
MTPSPFHPDELEAQARAGRGASGGGIRSLMPDQHREFFALLPYLFLSIADREGWPLAAMLSGAPGFAQAPDPATLRIAARPGAGDPAAELMRAGAEIGVLGIDLATRRRNRANGSIAAVDDGGFTVAVRQSFGNCPQYIQRRAVAAAPREAGALERLAEIDEEARRLIERADTFFVASRSRPESGEAGGADISHRGGRPGFVRVEDGTLTVPDFRGNRYYNTLGNLLGEPRAGLLFLDFASGDVLQLQGTVEIDWSERAALLLEGAERLWHFRFARGWRRRAAIPLSWSFLDYSPVTLGTGSWSRRLA